MKYLLAINLFFLIKKYTMNFIRNMKFFIKDYVNPKFAYVLDIRISELRGLNSIRKKMRPFFIFAYAYIKTISLYR